MATYDELMEEFTELSEQVFRKIAKLLTMLDIPIAMAPGSFTSGEEVLEKMFRCRDLVYFAPMPEESRAALNTVMLLWIAAFCNGSWSENSDAGGWLLEAGLIQMIRLDAEIELVAGVMRGEIEVDVRKLDDDKE